MGIKEIGSAIKNRRKELRITQLDLAELAEVSKNTLYQLERGESNPTIEILEQILEILGMQLIVTVKS